MKYKGGCHCGNLEIEFETSLNPAEIEVRACQCTFCRKHSSLAVTDPAGHLAIRAAHGKNFERYVFGLRTAKYLICKTCGVYVAAVTMGESAPRGIAIVNCLDDRRQFTSPRRSPLITMRKAVMSAWSGGAGAGRRLRSRFYRADTALLKLSHRSRGQGHGGILITALELSLAVRARPLTGRPCGLKTRLQWCWHHDEEFKTDAWRLGVARRATAPRPVAPGTRPGR
jgi:hypothetical protein